MEKVSKTFNNFANIMDQNNKGVLIGCYSVALVGLTVALRKVRPFSKFKKPSDVPNHFLREKQVLSGIVKGIDPNGALLLIQHKPLVNLPFISSGHLPVKISRVKVSGLGINWLQAIVAGNEVKFLPVAKDKDFLQCQVMLLQIDKDKKQQVINIGEHLMKIGFGSMETFELPVSQDKFYLSYQHRLEMAEKYWLRKELGLKYYIKPSIKVLNNILKRLSTIPVLLKNASKASNHIQKIYIS